MTFANFNDMNDLRLFNAQAGRYFFSPNTLRSFGSRIQDLPPYGGCVFVTSEADFYGTARRYTVRVMAKDGSIDTWGGFRDYGTRAEAHREAKWLGEQVRKGFLTYKDHRLFVEAK
jgi:hypothetical protein|tara:strand:+ start:2210 stop:2557 length:348 start_codon:yes stop_codon:yes gene_type:complete